MYFRNSIGAEAPASRHSGRQLEPGAERFVAEDRHDRSDLPHRGDTGRSPGSEDHRQHPNDHAAEATESQQQARGDHFEFTFELDAPAASDRGAQDVETPVEEGGNVTADENGDGRPDPDPAPTTPMDQDPDPAPPPLDPPVEPEVPPVTSGRPGGATPGTPQVTPPSPPPGSDNAESGRDPDAMPDPGAIPLTGYTSGGPAGTAYNVTIDFVGTWTAELQSAFIEAADYLSTIILGDLPDALVDGIAIDDITITATLDTIDGVGGILGSAGPRELRGDGSYLPATGAMTFDSADAQNQLGLGNWEAIILHEMMHAMGFGSLWSLMGLTSGSVGGGDLRFTGANATDVYQSEFPGIAANDPGAPLGVPVETDGGSGTAGSHWDEVLFNAELMTGYVDTGSFVSLMTIAALEDMGYDTVFDSPYSATDQSAPIPPDPLLDIMG